LNFGIEKSYSFNLILLYIYQYIQPQPTQTLRTILLRGNKFRSWAWVITRAWYRNV